MLNLPKNSRLDFLVLEVLTSLTENRALVSEAKVQSVVPRAAWHWSGDSTAIKIPSGHQAAPRRIRAFRLYVAVRMVIFCSPVP